MHGSEKSLIAERLVQKRRGSVYERFPLCTLIGVTSGELIGRRHALSARRVCRSSPVILAFSHPESDSPRAPALRVKEVLSGGKYGSPESRRSNQAADRFPDARVVIHDPDQRGLRLGGCSHATNVTPRGSGVLLDLRIKHSMPKETAGWRGVNHPSRTTRNPLPGPAPNCSEQDEWHSSDVRRQTLWRGKLPPLGIAPARASRHRWSPSHKSPEPDGSFGSAPGEDRLRSSQAFGYPAERNQSRSRGRRREKPPPNRRWRMVSCRAQKAADRPAHRCVIIYHRDQRAA